MRIIESLCSKCGLCKAECHRNAIFKNEEGEYFIDSQLCDECEGLLDVQCARVCKSNCISRIVDGKEIIIKNISPELTRLRPDHLLYLIAIMGTGNSGRYTTGRERAIERSIIANAFIHPNLEIRIVPIFDDCCISCPRKKEPLHREHLIFEDTKTIELLGFKFGQIINFWDAVSKAKKIITPDYLRSVRKSEVFIEDFESSVFPN